MKKTIYLFFFVLLISGIGYSQALSGNYYIPQGANPQGFPTLSAAVTSLNTNGASGTVNFILDADTLRENSFVISANLSAVNNVVVKPASGRNVVLIVTASASVGNGPFMVGFTKGYVTFDGSNNGTNSRNLIVTTEQITPTVDVPFALNSADADSVVLKNLIIKNIFAGQTNFRYGAVINDIGGVMGFQVVNCQIGTSERPVRRDGLAPWGGAGINNQFSFVNNEIYCGTRGVATIYLENSEIIGNTINIKPTTAGNTNNYIHGMYITGHFGSLLIHENVINILEKSNVAGTYVMGIALAGNNATEADIISIVNNIINVGAADETGSTYGIGLRSTQTMGNLKVYYNTILINNNASTLRSYGIGNHTNGTGPVNIDLKDNIIVNNHTGFAGSSAIGLIPVTSVLTSNYNDLYSNQNLVNFHDTLFANLAAWQGTSQDLNSVSKAVNFVSATDLHLTGTSLGDFDLAGTPMTGITTDIDGDTRGLVYPYMGADEGSIPLQFIDFWTENFEYPAGDTLTAHGWNAHSGAGSQPITVNPVGLTFPGYPQSGIGLAALLDNTGEDIHKLFPEVASGPVYTSFMVKVDAAPTGYFLHYAPNPHNTFDFRGRIWVKTNGAGGLAIGFSYQSADTLFTGFNYTLGETLLLVSKYQSVPGDFNDVVSLYIFDDVNPISTIEPLTPTLGPITNPNSGQVDINPGSVNLRQYNSGQNIIVDGISVASSWEQVVPVELTSFSASADNGNVILKWTTATETNNSGFEIQRSSNGEFATIGFVKGAGTTLQLQSYSFTDNNVISGTYSYRLKQIDFNGAFDYSNVIEIDVTGPLSFELSQNYPNPFNPNTVIEYTIASPTNVTLTVYTVLGEKVADLVNNQFTEAGKHSVNFNASDLASGTYIYRIQAGDFVSTKKMLLTK